MTNLCTLFDSNYLSRGLALYASLQNVSNKFHLFVIAFDKQSYDYLQKASLPSLTVISLHDFEDNDLLEIKSSRSAAEYCWTCTPSAILYCLEKYNLPSCTYIDADLFFYDDPQLLLNEMNSNSVLISEHRYTKDYDVSETHGTYCVQFMCFKNTNDGLTALRWWRERCLEWCYARLEDGKFGDQKYLDDWLKRFDGIHVLRHLGGGVAPWNVQQYEFYTNNKKIYLKRKTDNTELPVIFFHFHGLRFYTDGFVSFCGAIRDFASMVKQGKASPFRPRNYNFKMHYHFHKLDQFK